MSRKKRVRSLIVLGAALVLVVGGYFVVRQLNREDESGAASAEKEVIASYDAAQMTKLSYVSPQSKTTLSFTNGEGGWVYDDDPSYPVNQTLLTSMATAISKIGVERRIDTAGAGLADFGLDAPDYTVRCSYRDETGTVSNCTYFIGAYNDFSESFYFSKEGDDTVYMVASALAKYYEYDLNGLLATEVMPAINSDTVKSCTVTLHDGTVNTVTDAEGIKGLLSLYNTLNLKNLYSYQASETQLREAGFEEADTVQFVFTEEITVQDSDNENSVSKVEHEKTVTVQLGSLCTAQDGTEQTALRFDGLTYIYLTLPETANALRTYATYEAPPQTDTTGD